VALPPPPPRAVSRWFSAPSRACCARRVPGRRLFGHYFVEV